MNKLLPGIALLFAPVVAFSQARLVINGASTVTIMENGGTKTTPIYIEIANPAANAITTSGSNGWIVSESEFNMVKWDIGTTKDNYTIPFGYGTSYYLPLTVDIGTAGVGSGSILFSTYHTIADQWKGVTSTTGAPSDVTSMLPSILPGLPLANDNSYNVVDRFWVIDASKFPFGLLGLGKPAISQVTFNYIHGDGVNSPSEFASPNVSSNESDLIAQRFNTTLGFGWGDWLGAGNWSKSGTIGTVTNTENITALNFFRSWTLSNSNNPLPIQLSSFTAQCDNNAALIQWTSQTEIDNAYYTVEKTTDGVHFETVATVTGAGNSSLPKDYSIVDNSPYTGASYYRLYQTDYDGNMNKVGDDIPFEACGGDVTPTATVKSYATTNYIEVQINSPKADNFDISVTNMLGQTIFSGIHAVALGNNDIRLPDNIPAGVYVLNVRNDKVNYAQKMLIGVR